MTTLPPSSTVPSQMSPTANGGRCFGCAAGRFVLVQRNAMYYVAVSLSKAGPMTITTVRLPPEIEADLSASANQLTRTKSWVINQALREFLARQVLEQARWQETLLAMESVAKGKLVAEKAVHTWLASWGTADELPPPKAG